MQQSPLALVVNATLLLPAVAQQSRVSQTILIRTELLPMGVKLGVLLSPMVLALLVPPPWPVVVLQSLVMRES